MSYYEYNGPTCDGIKRRDNGSVDGQYSCHVCISIHLDEAEIIVRTMYDDIGEEYGFSSSLSAILRGYPSTYSRRNAVRHWMAGGTA